MKVIVRIFLKLFGFYVFSLFRKAVTVSEFQNQRRDDIPVYFLLQKSLMKKEKLEIAQSYTGKILS